MAKVLEFDDEGNIIVDTPPKAIVRFPTHEEQARGIVEVPREDRLNG